jgi:3-oxoacyl-(acyl-carrier-protein) synthase/acyl carrier protein/NAD(P)-dependent dehydrogenase (short-subunit alcohol dehydrogenase family)
MTAPFASKFNLTPEEKKLAIAVIGMGALFPGRPGISGFWSVIKNGYDTLTDIPLDHFDVLDYFDPDPKAQDRIYSKRGSFVSQVPFEPLKYGISPKDMESIDSTQLLGLLVADSALIDAGYPPDKTDHSRTAVILGVTGALKMVVSLGTRLAHPQLRRALADAGVEPELAKEVLERFKDSFPPWKEVSFPGLLGNVTAGRIASRLNLGGANLVVDAACASSLAAISQAILELRSGKADLVVSGGMDTFSDPFMFTCFSKTPALSRTGEVRSFDASGDGTMLGEGLGVVVLKRLAEAERDNNRVYAVIRAVGAASDGRGTAIFAPSSQGQKRALEAAYQEAGWDPQTVELLEAHGTGTAVGDTAELKALSEFFQKEESPPLLPTHPWCALGSVKSQIGHTKAAAGVAGLIKAILSLHHKVLPPTIKVKNPLDPLKSTECPFYLNTEARPWLAKSAHPRRAGVSAFGFGGSNFHCLLEEAEEIKMPFETGVHLVPFSGKDFNQINQAILDLTEEALIAVPSEALEDVKFTADYFSQAVDYHLRPRLSAFNPEDPEKLFLAFPAEKAREFLGNLPDFLTGYALKKEIFSLPDGIFFGKTTSPRPLLFYSPGSFNLKVGTGKDLALNFSHFQMILDLFSESFPGTPLGHLLYPPPLAPDSLKNKWLEELGSLPLKYYLEPALSIALNELYQFFGIKATQTSGRGPGLIAALVIAGQLPLKELIKTLGKIKPDSPASELREALFALPLEDPKNDGFPQLLNPSGQPFQSKEEITSLILEDLAHLEKGEPINEDPSSLYPEYSLLYSGTPEGPDALSLSLVSDGRILTTPRTVLEFAKNLALLASWGEKVQFKNWSYFTFPPPKPGGYYVYLNGANLFTPKSQPPQKLTFGPSLGALESQVNEIKAIQGQTLEILSELTQKLASLPTTLPLTSTPLEPGVLPWNKPEKLVEPLTQSAPSPPQSTPKTTGPNPRSPLEEIRHLISRETGYPQESLHPSLSLEEDLGVDSIKKVELLAEVANFYPVALSLNLNSLETIGEIANAITGALGEKGTFSPAPLNPGVKIPSPSLENANYNTLANANENPNFNSNYRSLTLESPKTFHPQGPSFLVQSPQRDVEENSQHIIKVISRETGYPLEALTPSLHLENDLGLDSIKKVEILAAISEYLPGLSPQILGKSETISDLLELAKGTNFSPQPNETPRFSSPVPQPCPQPQNQTQLQPQLLTLTPPRHPEPQTREPHGTEESQIPLVIRLVAQETGYPVATLNPTLDLENDLGLDSIKKVEILAAISEASGIPPQSPRDLTEARTLGDWLAFFEKKSPATPQPFPTPLKESQPSRKFSLDFPKPPSKNEITPDRLGPVLTPEAEKGALAAGKTLLEDAIFHSQEPHEFSKKHQGVPPQVFQVETLSTTLDSLGDNLDPAFSPFLIVGEDALSLELEKKLLSLNPAPGAIVERVSWGSDLASLTPRARTLVLAWPGPDRDPLLILQALRAFQSQAQTLTRVTGITYLGGSFGFTPGGLNSASAALAGLIKCAAWEEKQARVVDLPLAVYEFPTPNFIPGILDALMSPGPVEIGLPHPDRPITLGLSPYPTTLDLFPPPTLPLASGDTVLVTGGGRGITARLLQEISKHQKLRFLILGRTPLGPPEPSWLSRLNTKEEITQALYLGEKLSPKELGARANLILASRELQANLSQLRDLGAETHYLAGDFEDARVLEGSLRQLRSRFGPIRGLIHGAGVLADKPLLQKDPADFSRVFQTKALLASTLLEALAPEPLSLIVFMSSSTSRFGRPGQADYAAGNEVLNKMTRDEAANRPEATIVSFNWGPWDGGMVTPILALKFRSEKIGLIDLDLGAQTFVSLLSQGFKLPQELVVLGGDTDLKRLPLPIVASSLEFPPISTRKL